MSRRRAIAGAALITVALTVVGHAQPQAPTKKFTPHEAAATACVQKTISTTGMVSTAGMRECWLAEVGKAQTTLAAEVQRFAEVVKEPGRRKNLTNAQDAWEASVKATCNLYLSVFEGTMWHPVSDGCVLRKVEERTAEIRRMREEYEK